MRTTEIIICVSCLVLALVLTFGDASRVWRPQGRFGKRTQLSGMSRVLAAGSDEGVVGGDNVVYPSGELSRLCADSRYAGFPGCSGIKRSAQSASSSSSSETRLRNLRNLADILDL